MQHKSIAVKRLESSLVGTSANPTGDEREGKACQRATRRTCVCGNSGNNISIVSKCSSTGRAHDTAHSRGICSKIVLVSNAVARCFCGRWARAVVLTDRPQTALRGGGSAGNDRPLALWTSDVMAMDAKYVHARTRAAARKPLVEALPTCRRHHQEFSNRNF